MKKNIYIMWVWGIWVSAIARYYLYKKANVYWNDLVKSELVKALEKEWVKIMSLERAIENAGNIYLVIYTEAIPSDNKEHSLAKLRQIKTRNYPEALGKIANKKNLIAVTWTHWKSTTSSLISILLKKSKDKTSSIVWTILNEFKWKNTYFTKSPNFVIEACEYKRSFLNYTPSIWIITNIEIDHLDYYKDLDDYISAFKEFAENILPWWFLLISWDDKNSKNIVWLRSDISYIEIYSDYFIFNWNKFKYPKIKLWVPWDHILFDAKIAYVVAYMLWMDDETILKILKKYKWVWRRMEIVWETENKNILMSDYGHHPTEISLTLDAIKNKYKDKKLYVVFQPHQYNRTLELLEWFKDCFNSADTLIIPDIYESRDTKEDKEKINSKILVHEINHKNIYDWEWLDNTLDMIKKYDKKNPDSSVILLLWAWNIDDLRYKII